MFSSPKIRSFALFNLGFSRPKRSNPNYLQFWLFPFILGSFVCSLSVGYVSSNPSIYNLGSRAHVNIDVLSREYWCPLPLRLFPFCRLLLFRTPVSAVAVWWPKTNSSPIELPRLFDRAPLPLLHECRCEWDYCYFPWR